MGLGSEVSHRRTWWGEVVKGMGWKMSSSHSSSACPLLSSSAFPPPSASSFPSSFCHRRHRRRRHGPGCVGSLRFLMSSSRTPSSHLVKGSKRHNEIVVAQQNLRGY
eukprot:TRINITY_DN7868_c0_g1_i2.p1 TRINITY_DN7868_c0_g1~~TRINITY_DN7868_c0_g1_i2.p1  ORF type:complete len:107 (+),score=6.12 TRINITY_DN7868_c0_g1_i2:462-782(+)